MCEESGGENGGGGGGGRKGGNSCLSGCAKDEDSEVVEARKLTAQTIIEEKTMMSAKDRQKMEYFPEFLEVLQAMDEPEEIWSGVSGQISKLDKKVEQLTTEAKLNCDRMNSADEKEEKLTT